MALQGRNSGFAWLWTVLPRQGTSQEPCPPVRTPVCLPGGAEEQNVPPGGGRGLLGGSRECRLDVELVWRIPG